MAYSRGFHRVRGNNFQPPFPPFRGRPPPPLIRPPTVGFSNRPRSPFSSDFVIGGGPLQDVKPPTKTVSRQNTAAKKPAHICVGFEASQRFPNAKERLHNVLQGALKGHSLMFDSKEVQGKFWQAIVKIPWPREMSFYGEGPSKKEAEKNVAAIACIELEKLGVINTSSATAIKKEAVHSKDEPKWIYVNDEQLSKVESFLLKNSILSQQLYRNQNQPALDKQCISGTAATDEASSKLQTQASDNISAVETSNDIKFWQDFEIPDTDFSNWNVPRGSSDKKVAEDTKSSAFTNATATLGVKDIFDGSHWKELSVEEHVKLNKQLLQEHTHRQRMLESRLSWCSEETKKLPVADHREKIIDLIEANQVVVLSGETGCGKTTQIPQYILDHAIQNGKGSTCNIVVTQPRRIVAMSIAERVAWERGEVLGRSIGYQVRLEGTPPTQWGRILFCTTGILLRRMQTNALLQGVSHVIVDEVHERDINTDFLLILLQRLLGKNHHFKVVVMSATVNSERFSQYFNGCPSLTIPGFTQSVTEYFLPDIHQMLGGMPSSVPDPFQSKRFKPNNTVPKPRFYDNSIAMVCKLQPFNNQESLELPDTKPEVAVLALMLSSPKVQSNTFNAEADGELVSETILHVCRNYPEGAILCFLAGWDEIAVVHDVLLSKIHDEDKSQFLILPLHSMLPMFNQRLVFERPPVGVRKVVLATNIAETSITIDDVVYVINAGNQKEQVYDAANKVSCLVTHWTSQASVVQRRGRAGRCKPGFCFNLFTKEQFENMTLYQSAEMQRISLEEIILQTKIQCSDQSFKVREFLSLALDPPSSMAVETAISELQEIGAMNNQEDLTVLGKHMAYLPVEPRIAKMIIYGAIFRCLDPVLTIAAGLSYKDPFVTPLNCREQADQSRKSFAHGSRSDHVALLNAFNEWTDAMSRSRGKEFVDQRFLHWGTLNMISGMRDQFIRLLELSGLVSSYHSGHTVNAFGGNLELVKAVVCAGLFPNAVKVGLGIESKGRCGKKRVRVAFRTKTDGRVFLHPSSVNSDERQFLSQWLVYHDKVKSTQVFIRDSCMVHPVALICLCGKEVREIRHEIRHGPAQSPQQPRVTLAVDGDRWMAFHCSPRLARVLQAIREEIGKMVSCSITPSSINSTLHHHHTQLTEALSLLLTLRIQECLPSTY